MLGCAGTSFANDASDGTPEVDTVAAADATVPDVDADSGSGTVDDADADSDVIVVGAAADDSDDGVVAAAAVECSLSTYTRGWSFVFFEFRTISSNVIRRCCFSDSSLGFITTHSPLLVIIVIEFGMLAPNLLVTAAVVIVPGSDAERALDCSACCGTSSHVGLALVPSAEGTAGPALELTVKGSDAFGGMLSADVTATDCELLSATVLEAVVFDVALLGTVIVDEGEVDSDDCCCCWGISVAGESVDDGASDCGGTC